MRNLVEIKKMTTLPKDITVTQRDIRSYCKIGNWNWKRIF